MFDEANQRPLVSVIMPTFNYGRYIGAAIQSVLEQTYNGFELLIIDNHSTDGTVERVRGFRDGRIRLLLFKNRGVIAASRNFGARHARGEFLAFLDSDDLWHPEKLMWQVSRFPRQSCSMTATDAWVFDDSGVIRRDYLGCGRGGFSDVSYEELVEFDPIVTSSVVTTRERFWAAGGFDESTDVRCCEDYDLWLRLAMVDPARVYNRPLVSYRLQRDPNRNRIDEIERGLSVIDKHARLGYLSNPDLIAAARARIYLGMGRIALDVDRRSARQLYARASRTTSRLSHRLKAGFGVFASYLPRPVRPLMLDLFHKARGLVLRLLSVGREPA